MARNGTDTKNGPSITETNQTNRNPPTPNRRRPSLDLFKKSKALEMERKRSMKTFSEVAYFWENPKADL